MTRLLEMFGLPVAAGATVDEMARNKGDYSAPMKALIDWAKSQTEPFTAKQAFRAYWDAGGGANQRMQHQSLVAAGDEKGAKQAMGKADISFRSLLRRMVADGQIQNVSGGSLGPHQAQLFTAKGARPSRQATPLMQKQASAAFKGNMSGRIGAAGYKQKQPASSPLKGATAASAGADDFADEPTKPDATNAEFMQSHGLEPQEYEPFGDEPEEYTGDLGATAGPQPDEDIPELEPDDVEPDDDGDDGQEDEWWMPGGEGWAHPDDKAVVSMERLEKLGVPPTDPVWDEVAAAESSDDVRDIIKRHPKAIGTNRMLFIDVARQIFKNREKDWE